MEKLKVLHIFSGYGGGVSALLLNIVGYSSETIDHTLLSLCKDNADPYISKIIGYGGHCIFANYPKNGGLLLFLRSLNNVFANGHYDAVHCHIDGWRIIPIRLIAKRHGIKSFVVHAHKTLQDHPIDRNVFMVNFNRLVNYFFATNYMTCSQLAANYVFGKFFQRNRVAYLIPNGMNASLFENKISTDQIEEYKKNFGINVGELVIGHVGRLNSQKNHPFIFHIVKELIVKGVKVKVIIVGDGELKERLEKMICEMNLNNHIIMVGRRSDISLLMQFFDLMLLPSPCEGLPTVAVECQAAGTPMFLSDTITQQCDMDLGLLRFLPLQVNCWVDSILNEIPTKKDINTCLARIKQNGFTAEEAGKIYSNYMCTIIKENR